MRHFLLIYDHRAGKLISRAEFRDDQASEATEAYEDAEREHRESSEVEIVLIGADSIATIERTHGHYFGDQRGIDRYLTPA